MKKGLSLSIAVCSIIFVTILFFAAPVLSASDPQDDSKPIASIGPYNFSGTIEELKWHSMQRVMLHKGGSIRPAHFIVKLVKFKGVSAEDAVAMTNFISSAYGKESPQGMPPFIIVKITSAKKDYLKEGMKIKVTGYQLDKFRLNVAEKHKKLEIVK
jgi:hypothetical protein